MRSVQRTRLVSTLTRITRSAFDDPVRRLQLSLILLVILNVIGTIMYMLIEGWTVVDAFYMTVITIGTVGFGEVQTLSPAGRVFHCDSDLPGNWYGNNGANQCCCTRSRSSSYGGLCKKRRMRKMIDGLE